MTKEQILNDEHWKWVVKVGLTSIHTKTFPEAYATQAQNAMQEYANQEITAEREKAAKLVEALDVIYKNTQDKLIYEIAKQSLTEYKSSQVNALTKSNESPGSDKE